MVGYKILNPTKKSIFIPTIYREKIEEIYKNCDGLEYSISTKETEMVSSTLYYIFEPHHNIAIIVIDSYNRDDFYYIFHNMLEKLEQNIVI